ncbi:DUF4400 domain-containing protein [Cysteiniphilum litorale]|uniref:DUF4400 domain-containing protein n=1 Tax=Cysteiniphilum litorale TaxID=2056700 RepID=UPI003F88510D
MLDVIKSLVARIGEALLVGMFVEVSFAVLMFMFFKWNVIEHLKSVYALNNAYLAQNAVIGGYFWEYIKSYTLDAGVATLEHYHIIGSVYAILQCMLLAFVVVLQKVLIAIISIPLYLICLIIGIYDGWIARELRRYRAGTESTRRDIYADWAIRFERILFIGYVSIPFYIPAVFWFLGLGIVVAILERMKNEYRQKYL